MIMPEDDEFAALLQTNATLAGLALAAYTVIVTLGTSGVVTGEALQALRGLKDVFLLATMALMMGLWLLLVQRWQMLKVSIADFVLSTHYGPLFLGVALLLLAFAYLAVI